MAHRSLISMEETIERGIDLFYDKRQEIGSEICKLKDECIKLVEDFFVELNTRVTQESNRADKEIDLAVGDLKDLLAKKKELDDYKAELTQLISLTTKTRPKNSPF